MGRRARAAYNGKEMFASSFPIGRLFGVDLRVHATLPPLLALALLYAAAANVGVIRGFGLCAALMFGIVVREVARAMAAAWSGLHLRALLVFPVGGVMAFASAHDIEPGSTRLITVVTPAANIAMGLLLLGLAYGIDPQVYLFQQPWVSAAHILRSFVWTQFLLGAVSLLPIASLSSRAFVLSRKKNVPESGAARPSSISFGLLISVAAILTGLFLQHVWLVLLGGLALLMNRLTSAQTFDVSGAGNLLTREAMQADYTLLSSSDTLQSALIKTQGSLQETYPVVRGDRLVGSVSRDNLAIQLRTEGDGYIQGLMARALTTASTSEPLATALRRSAAAGLGELIAVVDGSAVVGILTPQGVRRAMQRNSFMKLTAPKDSDDE